jgi:hypothetical protein
MTTPAKTTKKSASKNGEIPGLAEAFMYSQRINSQLFEGAMRVLMTQNNDQREELVSLRAALVAERGANDLADESSTRQHLLARVAGDVAASVLGSPSDSTPTAAAIASIAVDVAEEILKKVGL